MTVVFLGGTCNDSTWRDKLIELLDVSYYNPIVKDWTEEHKAEELKQRENCEYCLYVLTPLMHGAYSIAELIDDSNKRPEKTLFCFLKRDTLDGTNIVFEPKFEISMQAIAELAEANGAKRFFTLQEVADFLNNTKL